MGLFAVKRVESFSVISWRISGMRSIREYEIIDKGDIAEVYEYERYYREGKDERQLLRSGTCEKERMLRLLNECNILKWNGFHGKHPRGVKDGEMFSLEATVNEGEQITASGSENFPKYFGEFRRAIGEILVPTD